MEEQDLVLKYVWNVLVSGQVIHEVLGVVHNRCVRSEARHEMHAHIGDGENYGTR